MSKKHFIWAAHLIANRCIAENIKIADCESYSVFLEFFTEFSDKFDSTKFFLYTQNLIEELQK